MSSATYDTPIPAGPDIPPGNKARFAALLFMRDAANQAFDKATALPRSAAGWVVSLLHRWVEATGSAGAFLRLGEQARDATSLLRQVGIMPSVVAVLSTPPVPHAALRVAQFLGRGIAYIARAAWAAIKGSLGRCGITGTQIAGSLSHTGTQIGDASSSLARHPMTTPIVHALRATLTLVRPVSQGLVAHRLLAALVPILWMRLVFELVLMPLVVEPTLVGQVGEWATNQRKDSEQESTDDKRGNQGQLLIDTVGIAMPASNGSVPGQSAEQSGSTEETTDEEGPFLNRTSRRAKQREDAHARRTQYQFS
jgi:hypothetical protein